MNNKISLVIILMAALFISACQTKNNNENSMDGQRAAIDAMQTRLYSASTGAIDMVKADSMIMLYKAFAQDYPSDSMALQYLFKTAEVQMGVNKNMESIATLEQIESQYPDANILPMLLQFKAFIYDDKLHDYDKARATLDELIEKYPNDKLVPNAKAYRNMIGKDPEEMFRKADSTHAAIN